MPDNAPLLAELHQLRRQRVPQWRKKLVESLAARLLDQTIRLTPVDTGRTRAAFASALNQLGVNAAANWQGPHPQSNAIKEGVDAGQLQRQHTETETTLEITNAVSYAPHLEYGTHHTAPHAMLRRPLAQAPTLIAQLLEPL